MAAPVWAILGLLWPSLLTHLPGPGAICLLLFCGLLLVRFTRQAHGFWFLAATAWTFLNLYLAMDRRLPTSTLEPVAVTGLVAGLPVQRGQLLEFRFDLKSGRVAGLPEDARLLVRWYRNWPQIEPGETWQLEVQLRPTRARVNFGGSDTERWYFSEGISATAVVIADRGNRIKAANRVNINQVRSRISAHLQQVLESRPSRPLLQALAVADRSRVTSPQWSLLRTTGTSHLLAISGMHIGLAALSGFWLGRALLAFMPGTLLLRFSAGFCWSFALGLAAVYALLAGMSSSTQRALVMLACFGLLAMSGRSASPWSVLQVSLLLVLLINPLAPLEAGFWLSFAAVAILLSVFVTRPGQQRRITGIVLAQGALVVVMMPLGMLWFQQYSFLGLLTNIIAIPWVSLLVVPLTLMSIITLPLNYVLQADVSAFLIIMAATSLDCLLLVLNWTAAFGRNAWGVSARPELLSFFLATTGAMLLLLPRGLNLRWCGPLLMCSAMAWHTNARRPAQVEMLDVGQGLAMLADSGDKLLLYDSGPGDQASWSLVPSVIAPAIAQHGRNAPDQIVISHADLDHAGGLMDLTEHYPDAPVMTTMPGLPDTARPCRAGKRWDWNQIVISVLHPGPGLPYLGNDSSCVLSIRMGEHQFLLMGDAGTAVEQRLAMQGIGPHEYLFAGHHGSRSASGAQFLGRLRPVAGLISTGFEHRFGFPHPEVAARFQAQRVPLWSSADCGAIRITQQDNHSVLVESARRVRKAIWRWPALGDCP